jgi:hypothetical protein
MRIRNRLAYLLLVAAVAACALPAAASAATIQFTRDEVLHLGSGSERNNVSVREVSGALIVTDTAGLFHPVDTNPFDAPNRCAPVDRHTMRCPVRRFRTRMGSGDDAAGPINTHLPVLIEGGSGNDSYLAFNPSFLTNVEFRGGSGVRDAVSYAASRGPGGGQGVRITNDDVANDGRAGLDTDNVRRDVETLIGSDLRDEITANGPLDFAVTGEFAETRVRALHGDDVVRVGAAGGLGVTILNGLVADGADKIIGGPAPSTVDYGERTRPVNATLNHGGADDGEAGERDEILGGNEIVFGGAAGDTLIAPALSTAKHSLLGRGGNDTLLGALGGDFLTGGPGGDTLQGSSGDDRLSAKDGERDSVDCSLGTDTVEVDSIDNFGGCEHGTIGVLRLSPARLRAEAGETARLKLSWRHPRSWRRLRRVELRLYRGTARVGAVAISTRTGRARGRGAVSVLRRGSRITRTGKTVSARLALRLDGSLAGRLLRVEVEAVDVRGARQLEPEAGLIGVRR